MPHKSDEVFEALVVGAGPAGIAAVGNLLDHGIAPLCWVDDNFEGGRLQSHYREVPANLKAQGFLNFATALDTFQHTLALCPTRSDSKTDWQQKSFSNPLLHHFEALCSLPSDVECPLSYGADLCITLTRGLIEHPAVLAQQGRVTEAAVDILAGYWQIDYRLSKDNSNSTMSIKSRRLILCTGSSPFEIPVSPASGDIKPLPLDIALSPTKIREFLPHRPSLKILVVGSSHSAVLVLKNLVGMALHERPELTIRWIFCHDVRFAEWEDGRYTARDNTGLKGEAAVWAREHLGPVAQSPSSTRRIIQRIRVGQRLNSSTLHQYCDGMDFVIQAIGYKADPLPVLKVRSSGRTILPNFCHETGDFTDLAQPINQATKIPGLYGAGIAFPARVFDVKYQIWEQAIGFPAFMRALKHWTPRWTAVG